MATISVDQRFALLAKLGENMDWDSLTTEQVQLGIREAKRAGAEATAFVRNGFEFQMGDFFHETGEGVTIQIPALPRPTLEQLRKEFSWIREEEGIERDTSPIEAVTFKLGTVLRPDEERIDGAEYERRMVSKFDICLGYQHACWFVEHQDGFPEFMILLGKVYVDFTGLVVVDASGRRDLPCVDQDGGRWYLGWGWARGDLLRAGRIAISGK